jgi:hypothetical protein
VTFVSPPLAILGPDGAIFRRPDWQGVRKFLFLSCYKVASSLERVMPRAPKKPKTQKEIEFDFIKSNYFRVVRADGVFGGLAPNGAVHMAVYSERQPIPQKIVHPIHGGLLGPELLEKREGRKSIVREVEVDVVLDIAQAVVLRTWLDEKINQYGQLVGPVPVPPAPARVVTEANTKTGANGRRKPK